MNARTPDLRISKAMTLACWRWRLALFISPVTMSLFDHGISGAMMTSIAVSPSMAKMTGTASVESD